MKEAPELKVDVAPQPKEEFAATEEAVQNRSDLGGESLDKAAADARISRDTAQIIETTGKLKKVMAEAKPETAPEKDVKVQSLKDKIMGFFGQAPEQLSSKYSKLGEERMKKNSTLRQAYEKYLSTEGEKVAQAYKEAIGKWPYIARDEKGNFVDRTIYSSGTGDVPGDKERGN